jgi:polar amino acid transport system substrate-binding protein
MGAVPIGRQREPLAASINFGHDAVSGHVAGLAPDLFWSFRGVSGSRQMGYEIEVGADLDWTSAELWASGQIMSCDTTVTYGGEKLDDNSAYYLRLRLFDGTNWGDWQSHPLITRMYVLVGGASNHPPYEFVDENGEPSGFNVELTRAIVETMGIKAEFRMGDPEDIRRALETGELDVVMGMGRSAERDRFVDFSPPVAVAHHAIFVRSGTLEIRTIEELRGREIIVVIGCIMHDFVLENGLSDMHVLTDSPQEALRLLASGKHDCAILGELTGRYWKRKLGLSNLETVGPLIRPSQKCFAVKAGEMLQLSRFSEGLAILKETGRYQEIYDKWLGVLEPQSISFGTIVEYLAIVLVPLLVLLVVSVFWTWSLRRTVTTRTAELKEELTERRKAEARARAADREKFEQAKRISGVFAHEIRNALFPAAVALNKLKGLAIDEKDTDSGTRSYVDIAAQAVKNATGTTRLISSFNKLDTEVMPERVDFSEVMTNFLGMNRMRLQDEKVQLNINGEENIFIRSNRHQLPMVFNNLLLNSFYALSNRPNGQIDISWQAGNEYLELSFEDNGCGIPPEQLRLVFEPFFSTRSHRDGIGIGLATTRKVMEMYGGSIVVTSEVDKRTRFDLKFELFSGVSPPNDAQSEDRA